MKSTARYLPRRPNNAKRWNQKPLNDAATMLKKSGEVELVAHLFVSGQPQFPLYTVPQVSEITGVPESFIRKRIARKYVVPYTQAQGGRHHLLPEQAWEIMYAYEWGCEPPFRTEKRRGIIRLVGSYTPEMLCEKSKQNTKR